MSDPLSFIDEFDATIEASAPAVYEALARYVARALSGPGPRAVSALLGCAHRGATFTVPPLEGQEVSGFVVAEATAPKRLVLEGRHRFASYRASFILDPLAENRTHLRARTDALFPGLRGAAYRASVIGTGGHEIVVRRILAAVAARAERMESAR